MNAASFGESSGERTCGVEQQQRQQKTEQNLRRKYAKSRNWADRDRKVSWSVSAPKYEQNVNKKQNHKPEREVSG